MTTGQATSEDEGGTLMNVERRKITWQYAAVSHSTPGLIIAKAPDLEELYKQLDERRISPGEYYVKRLLPPGVVPAV